MFFVFLVRHPRAYDQYHFGFDTEISNKKRGQQFIFRENPLTSGSENGQPQAPLKTEFRATS